MNLKLLLLSSVVAIRALASTPVEEMAGAANSLLAAMNDDQRAKTSFAWSDEERFNWHFIPKDRKGITLKELTPPQRHLAYGLLNSGLSQRGFIKATTIMSLEQILQEMEGPNRKFPRDPELYHVSIFGKPDSKGTWGWRIEGHHCSINFTIANGTVAAWSPSMFGTNPGEVRTGPRAGLRVLGQEEDLGRQLVKSLNAEQRKKAVLDTKAPDDILTAASRKASFAEFKGLKLSEMTSEQVKLAEALLSEYTGRARAEIAGPELKRHLGAGKSKIYFAWMGGLEKGERHYYRIHGPTFVAENDNTHNDANHVHAAFRDFTNDFGLDALGDHVKKEHGK